MFILLGLLALYLLILPFGVKKANTYKNAMLDNFLWIFFIAFSIAVAVDLAGYQDTFIYDQCVELAAVMVVLSPILAITKFMRKKKKASSAIQNVEQKETEPDLPDSAEGRTRIVRKFNEEYNLCLQDDEIEKIVNGSFNSVEWVREIDAMRKRYSTESDWYHGETDWLRAYLKAFYVQNVSSDFKLQHDVCLENFNEIFASTDLASFYSVDECIEYINNRYMTNFNDVSFMIAYRFLEENGKKYKLPSMGIVDANSEIDRLTEEYDKVQSLESDHAEVQNDNRPRVVRMIKNQ